MNDNEMISIPGDDDSNNAALSSTLACILLLGGNAVVPQSDSVSPASISKY